MQRLFDGPPFLSELEVGLILEMEPKCPECKEHSKYIYLHIEQKHEMWREVDGSPSPTFPMRDRLLMSVSSERYDYELTQPDYNDYPKLECENGHTWVETRLRFNRRNWSLEFRDA
jgi:hypothetical protein